MSRPSTDTSKWYERAFRADYLEVYPARSIESAEQEALAAIRWLSPAPGDRLLDLCCGAGRHSHWLQQSGVELHGLDLSTELLELARQRLADEVKLHRGDMRHLPFDADDFDHVVMFFTSFGYFEEDSENRRVLAEVARVLRPGGGFLLDLPDRESTIAGLVPASEKRVDGMTIREQRSMSPDGTRVEKRVTLDKAQGEEVYTESVRLYSLKEIVSMLEREGWIGIRCRGDWSGSSHISGESSRMIVTAECAVGECR